MKKQTTKKAITSIFATVLKIGYCELQYLLWHQEPTAYTSGIYGWNADIYNIKGIAICTGYRPFGNIDPSYELCRLYDGKAQDIWNNHGLQYEEKKEKIDQLLNEFIEMAIKEGQKE